MHRSAQHTGPRWLIRLAVAVGVALIAASCGGADDPVSGAAELLDDDTQLIIGNSPASLTTVGRQRILIALLGEGPNDFIGSETKPAQVEFSELDGDASGTAEATFVSADGLSLGLYVATYAFENTGLWEVRVRGIDGDGVASIVEVVEDSEIPQRGEAAPPSITKTAADAAALSEITTDPEPNPDFYDLSIDAAIGNGRPTVIVFATPAFCQTATCGPTIEVVKSAIGENDDVDVVHVEPYDIEAAQAGSLEPIVTMSEWGLATEPWVFLVDSDGLVTDRFEGIVSTEELADAVSTLG